MKFKTYKCLFFIAVILLSSLSMRSALCTSLGSGNWTSAANWSCGFVPGCGDSVVIAASHTVIINSQQDYTGCAQGPVFTIYGTLSFKPGSKLRLPCNSRMYIMLGGTIKSDNGGSSNYIEICNTIVWAADQPDINGPACLPVTLPSCSAVLPVELVNFMGEAKDGFVDLKWMTATEKNNAYFDIERSVDAASFRKISFVNSKASSGNSNSPLNYSVSDNSPETNISYYRLKQVDKDNTFQYSGVISVNYIKAKNVKFTVYPNPNKGEFTADISGIENNHEIQITLKDQNGKLVYNSTFFIQDQTSSKLNIIPENKLANGLYICTLTLEGIEYNVKVIVS